MHRPKKCKHWQLLQTMTDYLPDRPEPAWSPSSPQHCPSLPGWTRRCLQMCLACWESESFHFSFILSYSDLQRTNLGAVTLSPRRAWTTTWTAFTARYLMNWNRFGIQVIQEFVDQIFKGMLLIRLLDNLIIRVLRFQHFNLILTFSRSFWSAGEILTWAPGEAILDDFLSRNLGADKALLSKPSRSRSLTTRCYQCHRSWLLSCSISGSQERKVCSLQGAG